MNRILTRVLIIQLLLALFSPPISVGERLLFPADLWLFAWTSFFWVVAVKSAVPSERRKILLQTLMTSLVFLVVFLHGKTRLSLAEEFSHYIQVPKDDLFSFGREVVVAGRFFIGCLAGMLVSRFQLERNRIFRALVWGVGIASLSMIAVTVSPTLRAALGYIYLYDPDTGPWPDRAYGIFRSPIEGCVTLCLSLLILATHGWNARRGKFAVFALIFIGILLSKTLSALIAMVLALFWAYQSTLYAKKLKRLAYVLVPILTIVLFKLQDHPFIKTKRESFLFRLKPWSIYWESATSRFDRFLLGNGFHPHFSDNIFIFLFSRGGILLLGLTVYAFGRWYARNRSRLSPLQKAIPAFFILSGMTVDNLILRPVAYVFICAGVLALRPRETDLKT